MYSETAWISRLLLELAARGLVRPGEPLPDCRPETDQGRLVSDYLFLLGELHGLRPKFSFKGAHYPESEGLDNVLTDCFVSQRLLERLDVAETPLPDAQLTALDALERSLEPPAEFGGGPAARERWRQALVTHVFHAFTPMFKWPDGPWRGKLEEEFTQRGYSLDEFAALERFVAPYEGREWVARPDLAIGPRGRLSPLAADGPEAGL